MSEVPARLSTANAIAFGHLFVTVPVLLAVIASAAGGAFLLGAPGGVGGALFGCCVLAWPVWAWSVRRWRRWSAGRLASPQDVQRLAVATGLIGPPGSVLEQAEKTARVPLLWGLIGAGLAVLGAFMTLILKGSDEIAFGLIVFACVFVGAAIVADLDRSDTIVARIGIAASLVAGAVWVVLPRISIPSWAAAATGTLTVAFAIGLIGVLILVPKDGRERQRWTTVGVVVVLGVSLIASYTSARVARPNAALRSATPAVAIASPSVYATWASFSTGSNVTGRTTADGLRIIDVNIGTGRAAGTGDVLTVRYIMWLSDGRQADSSDVAGSPFKFTLGTGMVIQGWDEGVPGMAVGGTRRLVIPPNLAYADRGAANAAGAYVVPPNTTLIFIVQLLSDNPST
jgi:hypothetical protein